MLGSVFLVFICLYFPSFYRVNRVLAVCYSVYCWNWLLASDLILQDVLKYYLLFLCDFLPRLLTQASPPDSRFGRLHAGRGTGPGFGTTGLPLVKYERLGERLCYGCTLVKDLPADPPSLRLGRRVFCSPKPPG